MSRTFRVDLRGVVDLLSHHLYASPRVYVRELLQNGFDAITARRAAEPDAPARIRIDPPEVTGDGTLQVHDTGIGLTEDQVHDLLATIGRSSKRDELGFARGEFLGQFGIGLLSCFLVADEIQVDTLAAAGGPGDTIRWTGHADGRYDLRPAPVARREVGTTVTLTPRRGAEHWLSGSTVTTLARRYGSLLPADIRVGAVPVTGDGPPWLDRRRPSADRRRDLCRYAEDALGFRPMDVVDLHVAEAGLTGAAFVLPNPVNPVRHGDHRVYLKRMLLTERADRLVPDWAFFVRCVVDCTELRPTASREALDEDELLEAARAVIGDQLRGWIVRLAGTDPARFDAFLGVHHLGVKALALHDDELLRLVDRWWPMETTVGSLTLADVRTRYRVVRYTRSRDEYRQIASVAAAQGLPVVNAGYVYDAELIERLPAIDPSAVVEQLEPTELATRFDVLDVDAELAVRPFLTEAQRVLDPLGCRVVIRAFAPAALPAIYLVDRQALLDAQLLTAREQATGPWGSVLDALGDGPGGCRSGGEGGGHPGDWLPVRPQLVLNHRNPLVRELTGLAEGELVRLGVEALYGQALLLGHHPLRPTDSAVLNGSFLDLLTRAVSSARSPGREVGTGGEGEA